MPEIIIPQRYVMLIAMRPYFEDVEVLTGLDDDVLVQAYAEMEFFKNLDILVELIESDE